MKNISLFMPHKDIWGQNYAPFNLRENLSVQTKLENIYFYKQTMKMYVQSDAKTITHNSGQDRIDVKT